MALKSQSAMEYLMTYGWSILVIAIILIALFQLGIFNSSNSAPRIPAGSCQVVRNIQGSSLAGQCSGVAPQYVAQFNGAGSYVYAPLGNYYGQNNPITVSAWVYMGTTTNGPIVGVVDSPPSGGWSMPFVSAQYPIFWGDIWDNSPISYNVPSIGWYFVAFSYTPSGSGTYSLYVDGTLAASASGQYSPSGALDYWTTYVGGCKPGPSNCADTVSAYFDGELANVQAYNTSLSTNEINALYMEGIGGAPIDPVHITGWWSLNGNVNDYSGEGNSGYLAGGVGYSSLWHSNYTQP